MARPNTPQVASNPTAQMTLEGKAMMKPYLALRYVALICMFASIALYLSGALAEAGRVPGVSLTGATFLGGSKGDDSYEPSILVADDSSIYISGFTSSSDFPVTPDAYDSTFNGGATDRYVSRLHRSLSKMSASTFIGSAGAPAGYVGGNGDDSGHAIAIDRTGNVFIAGYTESADYPVTETGFDTEYNGGRDIVVSKFDSGLRTLLASTYIGGTGDEGYRWPRIDMAVTRAGDVVVAGITHSVDFPVTTSAYSRAFSGGNESGDAFVAVLDNSLSTLKASTYLGGSDNEWRISIQALESGEVLVSGETESSDFPTTADAYDRSLNVIKDVFISRFDKDLSILEVSTLFGGSRLDEALDIELSASGEIVIVGYTESMDLPVTAGSHRQEWSGGKRDGFAAKFSSDLSVLVASTFFGGSAVDMARGLALDRGGNIYITGNTTSRDFPVTGDAFSSELQGGAFRGDIFLLVFDNTLHDIRYSSLIGGDAEDTGFTIAVDASGGIVIAGSTNSADFPKTPESFDNTYNGGANDNFLLRFSGF